MPALTFTQPVSFDWLSTEVVSDYSIVSLLPGRWGRVSQTAAVSAGAASVYIQPLTYIYYTDRSMHTTMDLYLLYW